MTAGPRWRRRKTARPGEIVAAAQAEFARRGFAAARLDDIAALAGISKGALYLYFETKTDLFAAVVREATTPRLEGLEQAAASFSGSFDDLVLLLFDRMAAAVREAPLGAVAKIVIGESRNFPDLAKVWHDAAVSRALELFTGVIAAAQARGEVRPGDPRLYAVELISPVLVAALWAEVFVPIGAAPLPADRLLPQHARTMLRGMRPDGRDGKAIAHG